MSKTIEQQTEKTYKSAETQIQKTLSQSDIQTESLKDRVTIKQNIKSIANNPEVRSTDKLIKNFTTSIESIKQSYSNKESKHSIEVIPANDIINYKVLFETQQGIKTYRIESFHDESKLNTPIFMSDSLPSLQEALKKIDQEIQLRKQIENTYGIKIVLADKFYNAHHKILLPKSQLFNLDNQTHFDSRLKSLQLVEQKLKLIPPQKLPINQKHLYIMKDAKGKLRNGSGIYAKSPLKKPPRTFFTPEVFLHEFFHQWDFEVDENKGWFNILASKTDKYWQKTLNTKYDWGWGMSYSPKTKETKKQLTTDKEIADFHNEHYRNVNWLEEPTKYADMLWNDLLFTEFRDGDIENSQTDWLFNEAAGQANTNGTFTIDKKALRSQLAIEMMTGQYFRDMYQWYTGKPYQATNPEIKKDVITDMKAKKVSPYLRLFDDRMSSKAYWQTYFKDRKLTDEFWKNAPSEPFLDKKHT